MITTKPPITNFTPFHVTRVALLRQQREQNWLNAVKDKPRIVMLDGSGVVKKKKSKQPLPAGFAAMNPEIQKIILQQLG
jgi:hypothetical protein